MFGTNTLRTTMSETKPKLNLRPAVIVGEKSPPPTGLLISHGKPNFTIPRTKKHQNSYDAVDTAKPLIETFEAKNVHLKRTNRTVVVKKLDDDTERSEFLQAHKKISEKIAKENVENAIKVEVNNNFSATKSNPFKQPQFLAGKIDNGRLHTATVVNGNGQNTEIKINGHLKPALPEKPAALQNYKPLSPTGLSPNSKISATKATETPLTSPDNNGGVNYEQKTIVSFSKDLSSGPNKYPDTVKVVKPVENGSSLKDKDVIEGFSKLKFEIASNGEAVVPVIKES